MSERTYSVYRLNESGGADWVDGHTRADTPQEALSRVAALSPASVPFGATFFVVPAECNPNGKQALFKWVRPTEPKGRPVPVRL